MKKNLHTPRAFNGKSMSVLDINSPIIIGEATQVFATNDFLNKEPKNVTQMKNIYILSVNCNKTMVRSNIKKASSIIVLLFLFLLASGYLSAQTTVTKQLYLSDPNQALDRIDPVASSDPTTASTINLVTATAAVAVVNTVTNYSANPGSATFTVPSVIVSPGLNRLMLVGISQEARTVSSVTYGGTELSLVGQNIVGDARIHLYALLNPPTGTADVLVTLNTNPADGIVVGVTNFTGVDQTTPFRTFNSAQGEINRVRNK